MNESTICGIGIICAQGVSPEKVWENLENNAPLSSENQTSFVSALPPPKRRKADRFSDMACFVAENAKNEYKGEIVPEQLGTVYGVGFGPFGSVSKFASQIKTGDPDVCSPTVFSNTVSNSCVGHICIHLKCKGASSTLIGSGNIAYSRLLLNKGASTHILCGIVEEYNEELFSSLKGLPLLKEVPLKECAVTFLLSGKAENERYAVIESTAECDIGCYPLFKDVEESCVIEIENTLRSLKVNRKFDCIITSANGYSFDKTELAVLKKVFPDTPVIDGVKKCFGETFGASYNLNVAVGALILKNGHIPSALGNNEKAESLLVTGYDMLGNYYACVMRK